MYEYAHGLTGSLLIPTAFITSVTGTTGAGFAAITGVCFAGIAGLGEGPTLKNEYVAVT